MKLVIAGVRSEAMGGFVERSWREQKRAAGALGGQLKQLPASGLARAQSTTVQKSNEVNEWNIKGKERRQQLIVLEERLWSLSDQCFHWILRAAKGLRNAAAAAAADLAHAVERLT